MKASIALFALSALAAFSSHAAAEPMGPSPYVVRDHTITVGTNRTMLHTGIWTLGLSYVPAVIVAAESERQGDKNLYIPVAGPWLDLAARGPCPTNRTCGNETVNKVLIVTDGVFQGVGVLNIIGSFLFPEARIVDGTAVRIKPARLPGGGYGVSATGTF